jgi:hypothetical protein
MKREDQQDATIRCLLLTSVSTCFGHNYAHLHENKGPATVFGVLSSNSYANLPVTGTRHPVTPAPHTPHTKQAQRMHQNTRSRYTRPEKSTRQIPVQRHDATIYTRHSQTHTNSPTRFTTQKKTSRLISTFSRLLQNDTPNAVNRAFVLLKMGIMMPETC